VFKVDCAAAVDDFGLGQVRRLRDLLAEKRDALEPVERLRNQV